MGKNSSDLEKRKKRNSWIIAGLFILLAAGNVASLPGELAGKFRLYRYGFHNQTLYHPDFLEEGRYPDVFFREVSRNKKVCVNADFRPYWTYVKDIEPALALVNKEYYMDNSKYFFREFAGEFETDPSLPRPAVVKEAGIKERAGEYFTELGSVNDMLRYVFAANDDRDADWSGYYKTSYFMYMWYYHYLKSGIMGYARLEDLSGAGELVAFWDRQENLFLMSRDYYREHMEEFFKDIHEYQ
ncbi:MAG: hypothetical protein K6F35_00125 [Lachnospiraceae bacterium]|nr:hypothetical protein [Lachnospiraceae bacterium]